jgi:chaperonin GroEL (HSP60 family)
LQDAASIAGLVLSADTMIMEAAKNKQPIPDEMEGMAI